MGKMITFLIMLVFIDLFFLATAQICTVDTCTITSIVFSSLLDLTNFEVSTFFVNLMGDVFSFATSKTGAAALLLGGTVALGTFVFASAEQRLYIPISLTLSLLAVDFTIIFSYLVGLNSTLALFVMAPIFLIYVLTILDWIRGKD